MRIRVVWKLKIENVSLYEKSSIIYMAVSGCQIFILSRNLGKAFLFTILIWKKNFHRHLIRSFMFFNSRRTFFCSILDLTYITIRRTFTTPATYANDARDTSFSFLFSPYTHTLCHRFPYNTHTSWSNNSINVLEENLDRKFRLRLFSYSKFTYVYVCFPYDYTNIHISMSIYIAIGFVGLL